MLPRASTSIRAKLALLAGVPVVGALLLALLVAKDARQGAASAASLGSIEDLARLTSSIADVLHAVEDERAVTSMTLGRSTPDPGAPVRRARLETDGASARLESFLSARDRTKLPARLTRGLIVTEAALRELPGLRALEDARSVHMPEVLDGYGAASGGLVSATAALTELSDDGAMLRSISALVALLELEERSSVEHAIVGFAASSGGFPPGAFKALLTATTEEGVYDGAFRTSASDEVRRSFEGARDEGRAARATLDSVLRSTEDTVSLDPALWNETQTSAMRGLRDVERVLLGRVESAAATKGAELRSTVRVSLGVAIAVIVTSLGLALFLGGRVQGSVRALGDAAERVRASRDFSIRARRVSDDELGMLTDTFNEMLGGIQSRDAELEQHRSHLEGLVEARTRELAARNAALRLVLDNVDQGLATIGADGSLHAERSAAFDRWFCAPRASRAFYDALVPGDFASARRSAQATEAERVRLLLKLGWEQVAMGLLPTEVSLDQVPKRFDVGDQHFTLAIKPILDGEEVTGALLVVSDVTSELEARIEQARQKEEIQIFQRVARDKAGFLAFLEESGAMVERLRTEHGLGAAQQLGLVHTLKGNAAQCEVRSVADVAHELESFLANGDAAGRAQLYPLFRAWDALGLQVRALVGRGESLIELSHGELARLIRSVEEGLPGPELVTRLRRLFEEPVETRFARLAEHAQRLAARLGKPAPKVQVSTGDLRLPRGPYGAFWAGLVHVVRNAVDHGVEDAATRRAAGKPAEGSVSFRARVEDRTVLIEIADDGAGIDWGRLADKARAAGLPASQRAELEQAIFASGVTTLDAITETSGRGVGLAAVREATVTLGGNVRVESKRGEGTRFEFRVPLEVS